MTTYIKSWYTRTGTGEIVRHVETFDDSVNFLDGGGFHTFPEGTLTNPGPQIETGCIATPYQPQTTKRRNTNAWKPVSRSGK